MSTIAQAKARYAQASDDARRKAALNLQGHIGVKFYLTAFSHRVIEAYQGQWCELARHPDGGWDWVEIHRRFRSDINRLEMAIWGPQDRLCGLGLAIPNSCSITLKFLEGDPRPECPLAGRRALIALEATALYAQGIGRRELRVEPVNDALAAMYRDIYGFRLETLRGSRAYYRREIA